MTPLAYVYLTLNVTLRTSLENLHKYRITIRVDSRDYGCDHKEQHAPIFSKGKTEGRMFQPANVQRLNGMKRRGNTYSA